eukprot:TRINITY_DN4086_c0_g1_i12.p1 TRINITY_DN4086_c0_g1~~TRINITY_DN4086_c0_g1_i12.p1  ORF type:complete len:369 (-),score=101.58 TRINITY_DN4086_c0_g1_i12:474-1580(-)
MVQIEEIEEIVEEEPQQVAAPPAKAEGSKDNVVGQAVSGGVKIEPDQGAKLDEAAQTEAWHWKEIDLNPFIAERLPALFKGGVRIAESDNVTVDAFKAEHWGESFATQRKGKGKLVCTFRVDVKWRGKLYLGDNVVGSAQGTIRFPEVSSEKPPSEWEIKAVCDGEDQSAMRMLNPCGSLEETPVRDLEPAELSIKEVMLTTGPAAVLEQVVNLMKELCAKANAPSAFLQSEQPAPAEETPHVPQEIKAQVKATMEQMRLDHLPEKFKTADWSQERLELSVCRLTDVEVPTICSSLSSSTELSHLDLSHNELSDIAVQQLVACLAMGGAPNLKELRITSNRYTKMGANMLSGLKSMRKGLKLTYDEHN